jgi:pimeloyl-ACP methyl ester carboxylesterase
MARTEATVVTTVSPDGTPIACWRSGQGPALVLVHGTPQDHTGWNPVLPALTAHFTCYAMDRRGRAGSGDSPTYAIEREFEDVAAVVDNIGEPAHLLGHSYGALCALEAALLTPNLAKLVLYEPPLVVDAARFPPGFIAELEGLIAEGRRDETVARFFEVMLERSPQDIERMRGQPTWATRVAGAHTFAREAAIEDRYQFEPGRFAELQTPTLLLQGEVTQPFLKTAIQMVHAALPNSQVVELPGQGHNAIGAAPDLFSTEVLRFLR